MRGEQGEPIAAPLSGGELNAAITRELVRIHTTAIGRGPRKSYTLHNGDTLITVMLGVLTRAERTLISYGEDEAVLAMRRLSQRAMSAEMKTVVARLTGRGVLAFMSDNHLDPDIAVQVFVLSTA
ncbi:MAG TPA: Na-translocating system protein MpsC family protein [Solirubrobacterales bacterium]|nr:Na-translocating system protein MpsC family protein [Solirubrobacterales bacterium]